MKIEDMTYKQFNEYCNERACDGQWSMMDAIACIGMHDEIEAFVKGKLFKGKARETAWKELKLKYA
jgi:hypothetical protein